jgi:uncharacterized membrane protein
MMKEEKMLKYVAMIAGLIIMCVPEDASILQFAVQGFAGLFIFGLGVLAALDDSAE